MPPYPLTNFEIQKYYQHEPRFKSVYSRDNLPNKIKDVAYVTNLDEYSDTGTQWLTLYALALNNNVTYFERFRVGHIPKEIKKFIDNIVKIQTYDSVMRRLFILDLFILCLQERLWLTLRIFFHQIIKENDDIILNYFMTNFKNGWIQFLCETHNIYPNLHDKQQQFRLKKINEISIKDYFVAD